MSRIFEALQRSEAGRKGGFADLASAFPPPAVEPEISPTRSGDLDQFPVLPVSLPHESKVFCLSDKESLGAEKFRFMGVKLRQLQQGQGLKRLLITSTIPEEGKSTIAANLAVTLARKPQHRVLLLDGDLRRPTLGRVFGLQPLTGLSEWLQGESEAREPIYRLESIGLWFLPAGAPPENPLELMQSPRLAELLDRLSEWFDWIVIDSPPVLPLADTSVWTKSVDGVLLVVREGVTQKRQLQRGLQTLDQTKLLGMVLNSSNNADHKKYYQRYGPGAP
jgi:capsular exopolysaccharide synthesis family protein